jgi:hypothetical protein
MGARNRARGGSALGFFRQVPFALFVPFLLNVFQFAKPLCEQR